MSVCDQPASSHAEQLLYQLYDLYQQQRLTDFTLVVRDEEIMVHSIILVTFSSYFRNILDKNDSLKAVKGGKYCLEGMDVII